MFSDGDGLNYSLCVLIVLVLIFWITCKCIGSSSETKVYKRHRQTPAGNSCGGYVNHYKLNVPSSKTSLRYLNDVYTDNKLENDSEMDDRQVSMHLSKQLENMTSDVPLSNTSNFNKILRSEFGY